MDTKRITCWGIGLVTGVLLISGCGAEAPPETRAGMWSTMTDCGNFALFVTEDGTGISRADYSIKFKDLGTLGTVADKPLKKPFAFEGRELRMNVSSFGILLVDWDATFSANGKKLSGTVHFLPQEEGGGCKEKFSIER